MVRTKLIPFAFFTALMMLISFGCKNDVPEESQPKQETEQQTGENKEKDDSETKIPEQNETDETDEKPGISADSFFWGTWVRMDNGKQYEVLESSVTHDNNIYKFSASDATTLTVKSLGTFTKQSDSVMVCNDIPYFRNGGTNLEYSLKLVGFTSDGRYAARAAASAVRGVKGRGKSSKYTEFTSEGESDENGEIKLTAPTANDPQTVTITMGEDSIVIPELKISNSGDYMGTVALVKPDEYNLKITGEITNKDNGYLYGNNAKSYNMTITITNISSNKCSPSGCVITSTDSNLNLSSSEYNLSGVPISTLDKGATKNINITVSYGQLSESYVDTGITVTIKNPLTKQEWNDYIPLRFFKGTIPITVAAKSPENNKNAALNGFIIYPDGNNQFFAIPHNQSKVLYVPTFESTKNYKLVFSGATVSSKLSDSTEMYYTLIAGSTTPRPVVTDGMDAIETYIPFGGNNHSEDTAFEVKEGFEAYLSEGEIDYYNLTADTTEFFSPNGTVFWSVSYENEKGESPSSINVKDGGTFTTDQLPVVETDGFTFDGWYVGNIKVNAGEYTVSATTVLKAKWLKNCTITYVTERGTVPSSAEVAETKVITDDLLPDVDAEGWFLEGWYDGETLVEAGKYVVTGDTTFTAKWVEKYTVSYSTEHGTSPDCFGLLKGESITKDKLPKLKEKGWKFLGWYLDSACTEANKVSAGYEVNTNTTLYAKWEAYTGPDDGFVFVEGGTVVGSDDYNYKYIGAFPVGRSVTLSNFYMSDHEVTQKEYQDIMGKNPSNFSSNPEIEEVQKNRPVEEVSWYDAIYFCNKYSEAADLTPCYSVGGTTDVTKWNNILQNENSISGTITCDMTANGYRLPTEAEWEYAARGGQKTYGKDEFAYCFAGSDTVNYTSTSNGGLDSVGWYISNSSSKTHEIKKKTPNALGLYDMSGNVYEWCWDWYIDTISSSETVTDPCGSSSGSYRVLRGGSWAYFDYYNSVSCRNCCSPKFCYNYIGFRLVRSAQ